MEEKIEQIKELLKQRKNIEANKILDEIDKDLERLKELEIFASEVKRRIRACGKSQSISILDIDELIIQYNIQYKNG